MESYCREIWKSSWGKKQIPQYILGADIILFPSCTCKQLCRGQRRKRRGKKVVAGRNINLSFIASACWRTVGRLAIIFIFSTVPLKVTQELVWTRIRVENKQTPRPVLLFLSCPQPVVWPEHPSCARQAWCTSGFLHWHLQHDFSGVWCEGITAWGSHATLPSRYFRLYVGAVWMANGEEKARHAWRMAFRAIWYSSCYCGTETAGQCRIKPHMKEII